MQYVSVLSKQAETHYNNLELQTSLAEYNAAIDECDKLMRHGESKGLEHDLTTLLAEFYNGRGLVKYKLVDFDDAIDDFTTALFYKPDMTVALYNRGLIHYRLGRFHTAVKDMKAALHLDPGFTSARQCLEQCLEQLKD